MISDLKIIVDEKVSLQDVDNRSFLLKNNIDTMVKDYINSHSQAELARISLNLN